MTFSRREALRQFWTLVAASPLLRAQEGGDSARPVHLPDRIPPLDELANAFEIEDVARKQLAKPVYDHIAAGAGGERTLRRNREFFERITFRPRMLVDVSRMDLSKELFGQTMFTPILVGPTANHSRVHPEGELATMRGARAAKATMVISHRSSRPISELMADASEPAWFQVDAPSDPEPSREKVKLAVAEGCNVICLTVGSPYRAVLGRDVHNRYEGSAERRDSDQQGTSQSEPAAGARAWPPHPERLAVQSNPSIEWTMIERLKDWSGVPVVLKGIMSPAEAQTAVERGADGIIVSNHGGRALDGVPSTIEALEAIAKAVNGKAPVLVDGGFRRGTDILKGLALGADGVLLGRPVLWALAAYGAAGVQKVLEMLQSELALAMGLSGKSTLASIDRSLVKIHRW